MNIILWIVFGAIVGWLSALLAHNENRFQIFKSIIIGIIVAVVAGWVVLRILDQSLSNFDIVSLLSAIVASTIVLWAKEKISSL